MSEFFLLLIWQIDDGSLFFTIYETYVLNLNLKKSVESLKFEQQPKNKCRHMTEI